MSKLKMKLPIILGGVLVGGLIFGGVFQAPSRPETAGGEQAIRLPAPQHRGNVSVEEAIFRRRSIRQFADAPLTLAQVSQLLWAAGGETVDGVTGATRAYPSAGGTYPLEVYLVVGNVAGLEPAVYRYEWRGHTIRPVRPGDLRRELTSAALGQDMVANAPVSLVFTAVYARTTRRYGERGRLRYVPMDVGGAGQNIHLQAEGLGLGTVIIGAFRDEAVKEVLGVGDEEPLYIMPVGRPVGAR